jgi:hypothetical protein
LINFSISIEVRVRFHRHLQVVSVRAEKNQKRAGYLASTSISIVVDPNEPDKMGAEGICNFLQDLNLDADSRLVLVMVWKMKAATQCEFSREEFVSGMLEMG